MAEVSDMAKRFMRGRLPAAMTAIGIRATGAVVRSIDSAYPPASKPGEPPHKRTGNLAAGVTHTESENETTITSSRAGGNSEVPVFLEFGTANMAARPYMRPVMNQGASIVAEAVKRALDGGATPYESGN